MNVICQEPVKQGVRSEYSLFILRTRISKTIGKNEYFLVYSEDNICYSGLQTVLFLSGCSGILYCT